MSHKEQLTVNIDLNQPFGRNHIIFIVMVALF